MKTLYLLRHAKSSWKDESLDDRERPLKKRGHFQADLMSDHLSSLLPSPTYVICSTAERTRKTLDYFLEVWPLGKSKVLFSENVYLAEPKALLKAANSIPEPVEVAMLVGHNPGLTDFANKLLKPESEAIETLRTCGFLQIDIEVDTWKGLKANTGNMKLNLRPKNVEG